MRFTQISTAFGPPFRSEIFCHSAQLPVVVHSQDFDSCFSSQIARWLVSHCLQLQLRILFQLMGKSESLPLRTMMEDGMRCVGLHMIQLIPETEYHGRKSTAHSHHFSGLLYIYLLAVKLAHLVLIWSRK